MKTIEDVRADIGYLARKKSRTAQEDKRLLFLAACRLVIQTNPREEYLKKQHEEISQFLKVKEACWNLESVTRQSEQYKRHLKVNKIQEKKKILERLDYLLDL